MSAYLTTTFHHFSVTSFSKSWSVLKSVNQSINQYFFKVAQVTKATTRPTKVLQAKIHHIRFRFGLCRKPNSGSAPQTI